MATYNVNSYDALNKALNTAIADGDTANITLTASFTITNIIGVMSNLKATISSDSGGPYTLTRGNAATSVLFVVQPGGILTIANVIIDGNKANVSSTGALINNSGAAITLDSGTILQNNKSNSTGGFQNSRGILIMKSGVIIRRNDGDRGAGVSNNSEGTITIESGAQITENTSVSYGGGMYNLGKVTLKGSIAKNTSVASGGGIVNSGTLIVDGGSIENNIVSGGGANWGGGGVDNTSYAVFEMTNGSVSGNQANGSNSMGGGVYNYGKFSMVNSRIDNNKAGQGGGIFNRGILQIQGGQITGNSANASGGGINFGI
jgi:hypothetical protein